MPRWAPIRYRDFWDVPRIFLVNDGNDTLLFDCPFDADAEEYAAAYQVWQLPPLTEDEFAGSWEGLAERSTRLLGHIDVEQVRFDRSKRKKVDLTVLDRLNIER